MSTNKIDGAKVRIVAIPLPCEVYETAKAVADESGLRVGTKIRMDMISYYNGVASRRKRARSARGAS